MKIAITGSTGFIGRYVVQNLLDKSYEVIIVGRSSIPDNRIFAFVEVDLLKDQDYTWIEKYKPSHLLHLAWYAEHGKFWNSLLNLKWCNVTCSLVEAFCSYRGAKGVVVAGSCAEYDWSFGYCKENLTPTNPSTLYGIAKDSARRLSAEVARMSDVPLAWGRIFFPFGIGENLDRLTPSIIQVFLGLKDPFSIGIRQWRDILPVEIVADAFVFLLMQEKNGTFNICSGKPTQLGDFIEKIAVCLDASSDCFLSIGVESNNSSTFLVGDNTSISSLGWKPQFNLSESLANYIQALKANL